MLGIPDVLAAGFMMTLNSAPLVLTRRELGDSIAEAVFVQGNALSVGSVGETTED